MTLNTFWESTQRHGEDKGKQEGVWRPNAASFGN